jgi:hypothetical protein
MARPSKATYLLIGALVVLSQVMFFIGAGVFVSATPISPLLSMIGGVCFFLWPAPSVAALAIALAIYFKYNRHR